MQKRFLDLLIPTRRKWFFKKEIISLIKSLRDRKINFSKGRTLVDKLFLSQKLIFTSFLMFLAILFWKNVESKLSYPVTPPCTGWSKKFDPENWEVARIFLTSDFCYLHNSEKQDKFWWNFETKKFFRSSMGVSMWKNLKFSKF
jgi:hypothetical protein